MKQAILVASVCEFLGALLLVSAATATRAAGPLLLPAGAACCRCTLAAACCLEMPHAGCRCPTTCAASCPPMPACLPARRGRV